MARLNTRPSSNSPAPDDYSDHQSDSSTKENHVPESRQHDKGEARATQPRRRPTELPTPPSDASANLPRGQKRKRQHAHPDASRADAMNGPELGSSETEGGQNDENEEHFNRYFDPNQDPETRQVTKRESRRLRREFNETRDDLMRGQGQALTETIQRADLVFKGVKQTADATIDSRLLVDVSDLAYKKTRQLVVGENSTGVDVDLFLSKCVTFLRNGGPRGDDDSSFLRSQRRRRNEEDDGEEEDDDDTSTPFDWEVFGRQACFPYNLRPPVPSFLLGPLSVEKKQRTQTQRRARLDRGKTDREIAPEALSREQLTQSDNNSLTTTCARISRQLAHHCKAGRAALREAGIKDFSTPQGKAFLKKYRISTTGAPHLFDFIVNPTSFSQTVENLFYISFLIKEGVVSLQNDQDGLPTLQPARQASIEEQRAQKVRRHQAILSLDHDTWKKLIEAFEIRQTLIPNRDDDQDNQVGASGWYTS